MQKIRAKTGYVMWDVRCGMCEVGCACFTSRLGHEGRQGVVDCDLRTESMGGRT